MVIKFPNWYEHFQVPGYDLDQEPRIFDSIYTGTETRDPETSTRTSAYESYQFSVTSRTSPGTYGGGWVDTSNVRYVDPTPSSYGTRCWPRLRKSCSSIGRPCCNPSQPATAPTGKALHTSFDYNQMLQSYRYNAPAELTDPTIARVAGYSLEQVDPFLGQLGNPIGIPLQTVSIHRRGFPAQLFRDDRHSD